MHKLMKNLHISAFVNSPLVCLLSDDMENVIPTFYAYVDSTHSQQLQPPTPSTPTLIAHHRSPGAQPPTLRATTPPPIPSPLATPYLL